MQLILEILFWFLLFTVIYTFVGYGLLLYLLVKLKRIFGKRKTAFSQPAALPEVTLLIAAYNEEDFIRTKIINSLSLDYPKDKLKVFVVTDGSTDHTARLVSEFAEVRHFHSDERKGKLAAVDRVIPEINSPVIVFSDANTLLNKEAIRNIVKHYENEKVGVVSGEKRIMAKDRDQAAGAGEGFYWRYESRLKKWDFELRTAVGAAGELFSIRRELYRLIPADSIIEDFVLSMKIAEQGYLIAYEPEAYAIETASASAGEEMKRKIRIAAGGVQSVLRFSHLLNPFRYGVLSFQFLSHRVLRWTIAPLALLALFPLGYLLREKNMFYELLFYAQLLFYGCALLGYLLQSKEIRLKPFFIPYYFLMMNYAVIRGFFRYLSGTQSAVWEKAKRAESKDLLQASRKER